MSKVGSWMFEERSDDWRDTDLLSVRALDTRREIADRSTSIVLIRGGVEQAAQTARIAPGMGPSDPTSTGGQGAVDTVTVLGESDFDVQFGDRFLVGGLFYEVFYVVPDLPGRVEAKARQVQ